MDNPEIPELRKLPQKSNDLLSLMRTYSICTSFNKILKSIKEVPPNFTIITKNNKYKCHLEIAAAVSKAIFQALQNDQNLKEYSISQDFDDSNFNQFASFLNGDRVIISADNRSYFKLISELLQIDTKYFNPDSENELSLNRFSRPFHLILQSIPKIVTISNDVGTYSVDYLIALSYSPVINKFISSNPDKLDIKLDTQGDISEIAEYFNDNTMNVTVENYLTIRECLSELEIELNDTIFTEIDNKYKFTYQIISNINLYDTILDINNTNIDEILQLLKNSQYYLDSSLHFELCLALENAFKYRPAYFESVIILISKLLNESFHESLYQYLKSRLLACQLSIPFLRSLYDEKIINHDEIIQLLQLDLKLNVDTDYLYSSNSYSININIYAFFAKEKYEIDPEKFNKVLDTSFKFNFRRYHKASELSRYIDHWDEYDKEVNMHHSPSIIYESILKDDADALQAITSQHADFDYDQKIIPYLFEKYEILLDREVSLASLAAFYGSLRCFRFLFLQQADISKSSKFAIIGGNPEIIRLVQQNGGDFQNLYYCAIEYHRTELLKWLLMNEGPIKDLYQNNYRSPSKPSIETAISSYNNRALLYFYDNGIDIQKKNSDSTFLCNAVISQNLNAVKLILSVYQTDPNKINIRLDCPPIYHAVSYNYLDIVKTLVEFGKCIIPKKNQFDVLLLAAKKGFTEIVDYLAPFYSDVIDETYINEAANEKIKEILMKNKK